MNKPVKKKVSKPVKKKIVKPVKPKIDESKYKKPKGKGCSHKKGK